MGCAGAHAREFARKAFALGAQCSVSVALPLDRIKMQLVCGSATPTMQMLIQLADLLVAAPEGHQATAATQPCSLGTSNSTSPVLDAEQTGTLAAASSTPARAGNDA